MKPSDVTLFPRVGLVLAALALASAFPPTAARAQGSLQVVMSGLNNPHGLTFGSDGSLYVAEAGSGGPGASILSGDGSTVSYGTTGAVSRYFQGKQSQIITGLPSLADQTTRPVAGAGSTGLYDIAFGADGTLYGLIGLGADVPLRATVGPDFATLVKLTPGSSTVQTVADLGAYETQNNPDGVGKDSNPYSLAVLPGGGFAVADAGGNDVVGVSADGKTLSTLGVFPAAPNPLFPSLGGPTFQFVPTSVKVGPDGDLYVGGLTGFPFPVGGADVYRLDPKTGKSTVFASGFTNITGLTFGPDGGLYVLDLTTNGLASPTGPGSGALIRVDPVTGAHTTLASQGLFLPTGLIAGPDDALYISNMGTSPGDGQVLRFSLAPVPEASTVVSFGLLLALSLGGLIVAARRKKAGSAS